MSLYMEVPGETMGMPVLKKSCRIGVIGIVCLILLPCLPAFAGRSNTVDGLAGRGAVVVADERGKILFARHGDTSLVPASTLKILTASTALTVLGDTYRFVTEFLISPEGDLTIAGKGDPLLISEEIKYIAEQLKNRGLKSIRNIYLDARFFSPGIVLHGTERSLNPYDAFNGALAVNFNTIFVNVDSNGDVTSAEPQTPITPLACEMARKGGKKGKIRLNLAIDRKICLRYAGELFRAFLLKAGVETRGEIVPGVSDNDPGDVLYRHQSRFTLADCIRKLLKYSNNFIANQIFLTAGAEKYGPPATTEKARQAVADHLKSMGIEELHVEEGSGLSRRTKITAVQMIKVLKEFLPHRDLLVREGDVFFKTGTLRDVQALAGYLENPPEGPALFVVLLNGKDAQPGRREQILKILTQRYAGHGKPKSYTKNVTLH